VQAESVPTPAATHGGFKFSPWYSAISAGLLFVALSLVFRSALSLIYKSWQLEEYSHGYVIIPLAVLVAADILSRLRITPKPAWSGFAVVALCVVFMIVFEITGVRGILPQLYVVALIGLVAILWGWRLSAALIPAFGLLLLAVPQPALIYYNLSFNMRLLSTSLGVAVLRLLDISVLQDGNIIDLGTYQLQVADACNGLRYLFPLLSLSYLVAYFYKAAFWKRAVLFFSALPITVLLNGIRIGLIGVTVDRWGPAMATGVLHDFEGWVFFMVCVLLLLLEVKLLQLIGRKGTYDFAAVRIPSFASIPKPAWGIPAAAGAATLAAALSLGFIAPQFTTDYVHSVPLPQSFDHFPSRLGPWTGRFENMDNESLKVLGTDDYLLADYDAPGYAPVNLYMLYYARQDSSSNSAVHTPAACMPAGGWTIVSNTAKAVQLEKGARLDVNRALITKSGSNALVYYWYSLGGTNLRVPEFSRLYLIKHALATGTNHGAMIRVMTQIAHKETEADAERRMLRFLDSALKQTDEFMFPAASPGGNDGSAVAAL
jgi:exosortase D (VPLPA-CTERM-specific)